MRTRVNGVELAYSLEGNGIPLLLIHGFPLTRQIWDDQISNLKDITRMIAVDLRGHGESLPIPGPFSEAVPYTMELLAVDCVRLLDEIGIHTPVVVGGLSMGGYVALNLARQFPERLGGLILVATRASADTDTARAGRDSAIQLVQLRGPQAVTAQMMPKLLAAENATTNPELVERVNSIMESVPEITMIGDLLGMKHRPDANPWLPSIIVPTLLVCGEQDQIIPRSEMEAMQSAVPNSRLITISGAGHLPNMEQPDKFNLVIRKFITSLELPAIGD